MIRKIFHPIILICTMIIVSACGGNTALSYQFQQGVCPTGVGQAPYCMQVEVSNNAGTGSQTWITSSSYAISGLSFSTTGASNVQTPSTSQSAMDPNNCTGTTLSPGQNCTFYLKINFESYSTVSSEPVNVTLNYTLNNTLFGGSSTTGSSSFTIYEVTNLYAAQSNGWAAKFNVNGSNNFFAESFNDPINTSATDTSSYGFLFMGGNNGIYPVGNESGNESSGASILPSGSSGAVYNIFTFGANLYATTSSPSSSSVWQYTLSTQTWGTSAAFTLNTSLRPNANAISAGGVLYLASSNQVFTCTTSSTTTTSSSCLPDGVSTAGGSGTPGTINALAFPNSGSSPFTGFFVGGSGGLFAESSSTTALQPNVSNTWTQVVESSTTGSFIPLTNPINAMASYNNNLYAADNKGNIWYIPSSFPLNNMQPIASLVASVSSGPISAITVDTIGGILYFATTSGNSSTLYGCNVSTTPASCTPVASSAALFPVVGLSIASQLVTQL